MKIKKIAISGFRGFTERRDVDLSRPVTILYGANANGKSSVLNSIEWCLFGDDCSGTSTRMRERVGWKPENRSESVPCKVTMVCDHPDGEITFERVPKSHNRGLTIYQNRKAIFEDDEANSWVEDNIGSFIQFMATIYQHQENIRHLAVAQDKEKGDIINRLLGLNDYNDLLNSIQASDHANCSKYVTEQRDHVDEAIKLKITSYNEHNEELSKELGLKVNLISQNKIQSESKKLTSQIESLAKENSVEPGSLVELDDCTDAHDFVKKTRESARKLLYTSQTSKESTELGKEISNLDTFIARIKESKKTIDKALYVVKEYEGVNGNTEELNEQLQPLTEKRGNKAEEIKRLNALFAVLAPLHEYLLKNELGFGTEECLACGSSTKNQQEYLKRKIQKLGSSTLEKAKGELDKINSEISNINSKIAKLEGFLENLKLAGNKYSRNIEEAQEELDIKIKPKEDPVKLLDKQRDQKIQRQEILAKTLGALITGIKEFEESCDRLDKMARVIKNKKEIRRLSSAKEGKDYKELLELEEEADKFSDDVRAIVSAITSVRDDESKDRVDGSKTKVREYFDLVAENPGISGLEMTMELTRGRENFRFRDASDDDVVPILSQGDLNVLALSIFSGLGEVNLASLPFETIIFDDPSQSMGSHHKQKLAELFNTIAKNRQVIISTMDNEFRELLVKHITKGTNLIEFKEWDPVKGPKLA